jgi:hypothetical protein
MSILLIETFKNCSGDIMALRQKIFSDLFSLWGKPHNNPAPVIGVMLTPYQTFPRQAVDHHGHGRKLNTDIGGKLFHAQTILISKGIQCPDVREFEVGFTPRTAANNPLGIDATEISQQAHVVKKLVFYCSAGRHCIGLIQMPENRLWLPASSCELPDQE